MKAGLSSQVPRRLGLRVKLYCWLPSIHECPAIAIVVTQGGAQWHLCAGSLSLGDLDMLRPLPLWYLCHGTLPFEIFWKEHPLFLPRRLRHNILGSGGPPGLEASGPFLPISHARKMGHRAGSRGGLQCCVWATEVTTGWPVSLSQEGTPVYEAQGTPSRAGPGGQG